MCTRAFPVLSALLGLACLFLGCQKLERPPENMPELHPVTVTILQGGMPLENAVVRLIPEERTSRWSSGGITDKNGVAVVCTQGKYEGVAVGTYKMTVSKIEMPQPPSAELAPLDVSPNTGEPAYDLISPEYSYPSKTPLRLTVAVGRNTYEPFDLGSAVRIERKGPPSP